MAGTEAADGWTLNWISVIQAYLYLSPYLSLYLCAAIWVTPSPYGKRPKRNFVPQQNSSQRSSCHPLPHPAPSDTKSTILAQSKNGIWYWHASAHCCASRPGWLDAITSAKNGGNRTFQKSLTKLPWYGAQMRWYSLGVFGFQEGQWGLEIQTYPMVSELLEKPGSSHFLFTIHFTKGSWQILLERRSREYTAFAKPKDSSNFQDALQASWGSSHVPTPHG